MKFLYKGFLYKGFCVNSEFRKNRTKNISGIKDITWPRGETNCIFEC